ncbi:MAG: hypothetical protein FJW36_19620 [Acidobacteria bacterium]|nr:hypothetical protein [Acidobacteriota bacterium]
MIVRIKLRMGPTPSATRNLDSKLAYAMASLLTPAAVLCMVVGLWRLLADLNITEQFVFERGLLSHWQVWLALGVAVQGASVYLDRYGRRMEDQA